MTRLTSIALLLVCLAYSAVTSTAAIAARAQGGGGGGSSLAAPPPPPPPPATPPLPAGTGTISGLVVDAATAQPIMNVVVTVGASGAQNGARRQLTDARGRFVLRNLPAVSGYTVSTTKPGYFDGRYGSNTARQGRTISIADGQWIKDVRIEMARPGAIAGTVVDERGEPIVGAPVRALSQILIAGHTHVVGGPTVKTDDRGAYRIGGLPEGHFVVVIPSVQNAVPMDTPAYTVAGMTAPNAATLQAAGRQVPDYSAVDVEGAGRLVVGNFVTPPPITPGSRPQAYPIQFYPNARTVAEATSITLTPGASRENVDFQLQPVATWLVAGHLDGPAASASGLVRRLISPGLEDLGFGSEAATALVGANGQFAFLNVPAGHYTLSGRRSIMEFQYDMGGYSTTMSPFVRSPGFMPRFSIASSLLSAPNGVSYVASMGLGDATMYVREPLDVGGRDVRDLTVMMRRGTTISGSIDPDRPAVPMPSSVPLPPNVPRPPGSIQAEPVDGSPALGVVNGDVDQTTGTFRVDGLLPGEYLLRTLGGTVKSVIWNGKDYTYKGLDATAGDVTGVVITTTTGAASTTTLSGVVSNFQSLPNGAAVIVFPAEREQWANYGLQSRRIVSVAVDNNGRYSSTGLPAGTYNVIAVDAAQADRWRDPKFLETASALATSITLDWGDKKSVSLQPAEVK